MNNNGINFFPLYWIYHDQWQYRFTTSITGGYTDCDHDGHTHFFMMGFDAEDGNQQAYSGNQLYNFSLEDLWSPRSDDVNRQYNYRIVGKPKWYFYVEEYWRRVYIQPWEFSTNDKYENILGKKGIKYDASKAIHTDGPFREGKDTMGFYTNLGRTLPIEYFQTEEKNMRDHWLRHGDGVDPAYNFMFNYNVDIADEERRDKWVLPVGTHAGKDPNGGGDTREDAARTPAYHDDYYMYPTIEYQKVTHLAWERTPGWNIRDVEDEETGEDFGDGFSMSISLPFTIEGKIQSPFSDDSGGVSPPGVYHHGVVKEEDMLRYRMIDVEEPSDYDPTPEKEGQLVQWNVPNESFPIDGKWVEQCLGGVIQAKVKVIMEDVWGGRFVNWVHATQFEVAEEFEGKDQNGASSDE